MHIQFCQVLLYHSSYESFPQDLQTPLHVSSGRGFDEITGLLLETGEASVDLKDTVRPQI